MSTNCAPLIPDLLVFCYAKDFLMCLSNDKQAAIILTLHTTFRYFDVF